MKLARVAGTVVSTIKSPIFEDRTLLLCDLVEPSGEAAGGYMIAVDTVGAGAGELVLLLDEGTSARQIVGEQHGPLRTVVMGIVDAVEGPAAVAKVVAGAKPAGAKPRAVAKHKVEPVAEPPKRAAVKPAKPKAEPAKAAKAAGPPKAATRAAEPAQAKAAKTKAKPAKTPTP